MNRLRSRRRYSSFREFKPQKSTYLVITENYLIPLGIILLAGLSSIFIFKSKIFQIQQITCYRDYHSCQNGFILAELKKYLHHNLFTFPKQQLETKLLAGDKTIANIEFKFHLPNKLDVYLTSTTPKVALKLKSNQDQFVLIDNNFRPTSLTSTSQNLPILLVHQPFKIQLGQTIQDQDLHKAIEATLKLHQLINQSFKVNLDKQDLYFYLDQPHLKVRMTTQKELDSQLSLLQAVLSNVKMLEEEQVKFIDVRFDQPVLKSY